MGEGISSFSALWPAALRQAQTGLIGALAVRRVLTAPIYRVYEQRLFKQVKAGVRPRHLGLILDGNRRYGRQYNLTDPRHIYAAGADKLDELLGWCVDLRIPAITLWVLSTDNFQRSREEVSGIFAA